MGVTFVGLTVYLSAFISYYIIDKLATLFVAKALSAYSSPKICRLCVILLYTRNYCNNRRVMKALILSSCTNISTYLLWDNLVTVINLINYAKHAVSNASWHAFRQLALLSTNKRTVDVISVHAGGQWLVDKSLLVYSHSMVAWCNFIRKLTSLFFYDHTSNSNNGSFWRWNAK